MRWLLERLGLDAALTGDLLEECARGRSAVWYWRQVSIAIWAGIWGAIFNHKVLALRAVLMGCAVNSVWNFLWLRFLHIGFPVTPVMRFEPVACLLIILASQSVTGWVVARTHRACSIAMVMVFAIWLTAWFVARLAVDLSGQMCYHCFYLADVAWYCLPAVVVVIGLFLGGIVGARPQRLARC